MKAAWRPPPEQRREDLAEHDRPPLAALAQAHRQPGVLDRDQQDQGPDDQRENAVDVLGCRLGEGDDDGKGVDRACPDIAKHETEGFDNPLRRRFPVQHNSSSWGKEEQ